MTKQDKVEKVMHEWKAGTLTSHGKKVTDYDQAVAIALSEAGLSKKYAEGGGVKDNFDALDLPISYRLINNKGEVIFKTNSFNKASDTRIIKGFEGEGKLKIIATDKSGNQRIIADGIDDDGKKYEKGGNMNEYSKGGNVVERRYVNKDEDYEVRYAKDKPSRMGYKDERKFAVGGEIGNTVSFKGDYGTPRSGVVKEKRGSSYIVATDDGDRLVDSYEVISFSETPIAKKKRFGFFAGGGEIEGKIEDLQAVIDGDFPQFAKDKAKSEIERLKKELHESKETKAEEKAEHKAGGKEAKKPTTRTKFKVGETVNFNNELYKILEIKKAKDLDGEGDATWRYLLDGYGDIMIQEDLLKEYKAPSKPTTRKAPVKKAVAKKTEVKKEVETPAKPKADHKKLVAKLKAKKGATPSNAPSKGHKRSEASDRKRSALPLGKRVSADGNIYYENRLNRADMNKEDKFEDGGEIKNSGWGLNLNW